jgi:hypothetical protein
VVEVQLDLPAILAEKEALGHKIYTATRELIPLAQNPEISEESQRLAVDKTGVL